MLQIKKKKKLKNNMNSRFSQNIIFLSTASFFPQILPVTVIAVQSIMCSARISLSKR